ncbi:MAG: type II secretion system protein [Armatimonadota bacterium]|nr:MAG: type II secretion system protein [Armatimonadota bacterium]
MIRKSDTRPAPGTPPERAYPVCGWQTRGFTLAEIMVVLVIVIMLAGIVLVVMNRARGKARQSVCASNLHQVGVALRMYAEDHDGRAWLWDSWQPEPGAVVDALAPYVRNDNIWFCPSDRWAGKWIRTGAPFVPHWRTSYVIAWSADKLLEWPNEPVARDALFAGRGSLWHLGGFNELYGDGRVQWRRSLDPNAVPLAPEPWPPS